jgi:integrase
MAQRAHGEGSMYQSTDGRWNASIELGVGADGKRRRRHVRGRTQSEVRKKLERLESDRRLGVGITETRVPTLGVWAETWIGIVERSRKPSTAKTYRTHIKYLQPLAGVRLDRLTSEHIEQVYVGLLARGCCRSWCRVPTEPTVPVLGKRSSVGG